MALSWIMVGFGVWAAAVAAAVFGVRRFAGSRKPAAQVAVNSLVVLFSVGFIFLAFELFFFAFAVRTDGLGFTLATQRWFARYWNPINSMGYRDIEHDFTETDGRRLALVVGDSFTAGYGIKDHEDRYSNVLRRKLGPDWIVANVAQPGWGVRDKISAVRSFPVRQIDLVALGYFLDIEYAARVHGQALGRLEAPDGAPGFLVRNSFFFNYVYWKLRWARMARETGEKCKSFYDDPRIWATHEAELIEFMELVRDRGAELVVVVFPSMVAVEESRPHTAKVAEAFRSRGFAALDLSDALRDRKPAELVVNRYDHHPNEEVNLLVGRLVYETLADLGLPGD